MVTVKISDTELIRHCTISAIKIEPHNVKYDVVMEAYANIPPENLFRDDLFFKYVVGYSKIQLGNLVGRYDFTLPGGVKIQAADLVNQGKEEVKEVLKKEEISVLDLFCGCGGMSKGLHDAGLNIIAGIDIWDVAINSYKQNFNHLSLCKDLTTFSPENLNNELGKNINIDVIVGGPPCQAYSIAGKRDLLDPRSLLFIEYIKYVNYFNPKLILMENVIGILSIKTKDGNLLINTILGDLHNYNCIICKLYASDFEVPQNRRRVIIIGVRKDLNIHPTEPIPVLLKHERIPVSTVLQPREEIDNSYYLSKRAIIGINNKKEKSKLKKNGFGAQFLNLNKPCYTIPARYYKDGYDALIKYDENNA
jgi:DNA-cytosine methyltransferase